MNISNETSAFVLSANVDGYSNVCAYTSTYVGLKLRNYDISFDSVVAALGPYSSGGVSIESVVRAMDGLAVSERVMSPSWLNILVSPPTAILAWKDKSKEIGHSVIVRKVDSGWQIIDPSSTTPVSLSKQLPTLEGVAICIFPRNAGFWTKCTSLELAGIVLISVLTVVIVIMAIRFIIKRWRLNWLHLNII